RAKFDWSVIAQRLRHDVFETIVDEERRERLPPPSMTAGGRFSVPVYLIDYILDRHMPGASGLSDIIWDMATQLDRKGVEVHVFGPYSTIPRPTRSVQLHQVPVPPPGYRNVVGRVAIILSAYREIRRLGRPGIIHVPEYLSSGLLTPLDSHFPVVLTVPG